ncbi:MAG: hypothetical protein KJO40_07690, partial [Deltaproteobacteria bacterium]|nr:hypothetical protein [Deltaproteobacteria bacterium]
MFAQILRALGSDACHRLLKAFFSHSPLIYRAKCEESAHPVMGGIGERAMQMNKSLVTRFVLSAILSFALAAMGC